MQSSKIIINSPFGNCIMSLKSIEQTAFGPVSKIKSKVIIISVILIALWFLLIRVLRILLDADDCIFRFKSIINKILIIVSNKNGINEHKYEWI